MNGRMRACRSLLPSLLPALILQLSGCGGDGPSEPPNVAQVVITPGSGTLSALGATLQFSAVARDASGNTLSGIAFTWSSSNEAVATVAAATGLATAAGEGTASITAAVGSVTGSATLTVLQEVASVVVTPASAELRSVGATQQFSAFPLDPGGQPIGGAEMAWETSDPAVATVDAQGLATARGPGEATIKATARGVPGQATLNVAVQAFDVLSAGAFHSCGVTPAGVAYCWGSNADGRLGDGTMSEGNAPAVVAGGLTFAAVSAGFNHTCGVTTVGAVYCWGSNDNGQLGIRVHGGESTDPVNASGDIAFAAVSAGVLHTCGVTIIGAAYCWGDNFSGQLGDGTADDQTEPAPVSGGLSFAAVSAGQGHTCGVTTGGQAYCWGDNDFGQLGDGTTTDRPTPVPVAGGLTFADVSAGLSGGGHTCGVTTAGEAYCWGFNGDGKLGDGTTANRSTPVPVAGGLTFAALSAGLGHTCGVSPAGAALCWGDNDAGQIGDGTSIDRPTATSVTGGLVLAAVSAGFSHTCGVTTAGIAWCWGLNTSRQLGNWSIGDGSTVPVPMEF